MSESNQTRLSYIEESAWNTPPSVLEMQALRITGESLVHNIDNITSAEIRSDRNVAALIPANKYSGGGFNFELSYGTFDDIMAAALFHSTTWATNTIKNGTTETSFTMERAHLDTAVQQFFLFTGMTPNTFNLTVSAGAIVTGSFDFMGGFPADESVGWGLKDTTYEESSSGYPTAATTTDPFNGIGNVGTIEEGGSALTGVYLSEISFSLANNLRALPALGYDSPVDISAGKCDVTGTINAYFTNDQLYDKFMNSTDTSMEFTLTDAAGNSYRFYFPKVRYESDTANATGQDTDVMETLNFRAFYDATAACTIQIDRTSA